MDHADLGLPEKLMSLQQKAFSAFNIEEAVKAHF